MARHKSIERPPAGKRIDLEFDGERNEGTYTLDGPMVTVQSLLLGTRRAQVGDGSPEAVARLLLAELAHANRKRFR